MKDIQKFYCVMMKEKWNKKLIRTGGNEEKMKNFYEKCKI